MTKNNFKFCPNCGSQKIENRNDRKWLCPECGYELYNNVAAAVGVIIFDKFNNVLFELRAKEPRKGFLALPGGFVDPDETAEDAMIRECKEEIGTEITDMKFLCTNPNVYEYKNVTYKTCDIFFTAELPCEFKTLEDYVQNLKKQDSEVTDFKICKIQSEKDIENLPIAFESTRKTLIKFVNQK